MIDQIRDLTDQFEQDLASVRDMDTYAAVRNKWLARETGLITASMKRLRDMPKEDRPAFGQAMNELRVRVEERLAKLLDGLKLAAREQEIARKSVDVTRPGFPYPLGSEHPIRRLQAEIEEIFISMGFRVFDCPEVETEYYQFEALNMPREHPARDAQATFYFDEAERRLLRAHCSTVQVHAMETMKPPVRAVSAGRVYRRDPFDATHSPMFFQVDVLAVDEGITMGDLKGTLEVFLKRIFHPDTQMRLRPGYFPFVEPGAEVDISCIFCRQAGCGVCSRSGWIEILGAGMVDPRVFEAVGVDPDRYTGFAFGLGLDRVAMLVHGIPDLRQMFEGDQRLTRQFA
jgi:phenylalanyl-tRNA synthetase alpha chain